MSLNKIIDRLIFGSLIIGTIFTAFWLYASCFANNGIMQFSIFYSKYQFVRFVEYIYQTAIPGKRAQMIYLTQFFSQALLQLYAPGRIVPGHISKPNKSQKKPSTIQSSLLYYKMNGQFSWCVNIIILVSLQLLGIFHLDELVNIQGEMLTVTICFAFLISTYVFLFSNYRREKNEEERSRFYEFQVGRDLNPQIGKLDLKVFCEGRPGLQLWVFLNLAICIKQFKSISFTGNLVQLEICVITLLQFIYVADYFWFEDALLTTMDITTERFGFMLCFGDLTQVPFTYTLQTMVLHQIHLKDSHMFSNNNFFSMNYLTYIRLLIVIVMFFLGYTIFRQSNLEKNEFRRNPNDSKFKNQFIETANGKRLLVKGQQGMARHMNYTGDLLIGFSQSLACGNAGILAYFYPIYFTILLIHREQRDNRNCEKKYGLDQKRYCELVPYRMIPYIY